MLEEERGRGPEVHDIPNTLLVKTPCAVVAQDSTGTLPCVMEMFKARKPGDPAVMAEVSGKRSIMIQPVDESGKTISEEREYGQHLKGGDYVKLATCRLLGKRLAEWVAFCYDSRRDQHPLHKPALPHAATLSLSVLPAGHGHGQRCRRFPQEIPEWKALSSSPTGISLS
jgi:hypothetical protein